MKNIFLIAAITIGCSTGAIICMNPQQQDEQRMREANPILDRIIMNLHPAQRVLGHENNRTLAIQYAAQQAKR
jgi:hypothetical protein